MQADLSKDVMSLIEMVNKKLKTARQPAKVTLPSKDLSLAELASLLNVLAKEYNMSLPALIRKLDKVSGDVRLLDKIQTTKDEKEEWSTDEDSMLKNNEALLNKWKGEEAVKLRKRYLDAKARK